MFNGGKECYELSSVTRDIIFISIFRNVHSDITWSYCRVCFLSFLLIAGSSKSIETSLTFKFVASHEKVYLTISHIACIHRSSFKWQNSRKNFRLKKHLSICIVYERTPGGSCWQPPGTWYGIRTLSCWWFWNCESLYHSTTVLCVFIVFEKYWEKKN